MTFDGDFADARMFPAGTHAGIIRLRVWPTTTEAAEEGLGRLLSLVSDSDLIVSLKIVDGKRIRVRRSARHGRDCPRSALPAPKKALPTH